MNSKKYSLLNYANFIYICIMYEKAYTVFVTGSHMRDTNIYKI